MLIHLIHGKAVQHALQLTSDVPASGSDMTDWSARRAIRLGNPFGTSPSRARAGQAAQTCTFMQKESTLQDRQSSRGNLTISPASVGWC